MRYSIERRRKLTAEETAFNAARREARKQAAMHCQCCGRAILANKGTIAHHGYERPNHGWQTASCIGAKRLPFEVDRTALGEMITFLRARLKMQKDHRAAIAAEKIGIVFEYTQQFIGPVRFYNFNLPSYRRAKWPTVHMKFVVTSASWNAFKAGPGDGSTYGIYDFADYKARHIKYLTSRINNLIAHIEEEQARYDGWKQTHKREGDQWVAL